MHHHTITWLWCTICSVGSKVTLKNGLFLRANAPLSKRQRNSFLDCSCAKWKLILEAWWLYAFIYFDWLYWFTFILKEVGKLELLLWRMRRWDCTGNWGASQIGVTTLMVISLKTWSYYFCHAYNEVIQTKTSVAETAVADVWSSSPISFFQVLSSWSRWKSSLIESCRDTFVTKPCSPPTKNLHLQLSVLPDDWLWAAYVLIYFWFVFYLLLYIHLALRT